MTTQAPKKKSIKRKAQKAIVTQDNRFIYAKYDMNANEMKFFMWIVAQLNSQRDTLFQVCQIPLSEIFQVWQWKETSEGYNYVRELCYSMAKKAYVEDFKLLDETTMKEKSVFQAMPLFKFIRYEQGQSYVTYQLNDSLTEYLLDQKRDFTQLKFSDIQQMKSAYSIRIYNMLVCELKQNRQSLKMNLAVLQNILEVPKSLEVWQDFKINVLERAKKDINTKSNLVLLEVKVFKTGRKITDLEFIFDYKNNDKRILRDQDKKRAYNKTLLEILESYIGKRIFIKGFGKLVCENRHWDDNMQNVFVFCKQLESGKVISFRVKNLKDIESLERYRKKAEELFYLDTEKVQEVIDIRKQLESGTLFDKLYKKV
ncbi:replication initiation protein [Campylobacter jejuni]|nr:replication initiation protein [Campylobacter jejuni]